MIDQYAILQIDYGTALVNQEAAEALCFRNLDGKLYRDGNEWCALIGDNIQEGVCAFSKTPFQAVLDCMIEMRKTGQ